jgi:hypothetical protein
MLRALHVVPLALLFALAGCTDAAEEPVDTAQYVTVRRAWLPGERDALIQDIVTNRKYSFLFVGDISAMAPQLYADTDSVMVLVPNPALSPAIVAPPPGLMAGPMFSASWNIVAAKITTINNGPFPPDTTFWHGVFWSDPADAANHGFALAFSRATTFNISPINTTNFDNAAARAGAAAGEGHLGTGTFWADVGGGGRYQVTSQSYPGAFSAITTGPYLGGQSRTGTQFGRVTNSAFVRQSGTEAPANFTVSFDYRTTGVPATEILCVFPSPCTTNVPAAVSAAGRVPPEFLRRR